MKLSIKSAALLLFIIACAQTLFGQVASFSASPTTGCSPLVVGFTNTTSGGSTYEWNLGNGVTTPDVNASTSYTSPGTYTVTLTAYPSGSVSTLIITVYPSPTVSFFATDTAVCPGSPVLFESTTSAGAGVSGPITYSWNFGDGTSGTGADPTHTYYASGYYNITLSATNSKGCVASLTEPAYIYVYTPSSPYFTVSPAYICNPPGTVTFTNTTSGFGPFSSTWTFGDGSGTGTGSPTSHIYTATGDYTVKLVETDGHGCTDSVTIPDAVIVSSITAAFSGPATACLYSTVDFTNLSTGYATSSWNFGNGATSSSTTGSTTYSSPGTYTVTLTVSNGGCSQTVTHTITIEPAATGTFTVNPTESCPPPVLATFATTLPAGATVTWLYGDGTSGSSLTHDYTACGIDTVRMIITTAGLGCVDTVKKVYYIYNLNVAINDDTVVSGCLPLTATFSCTATTSCPFSGPYPYPIISYKWNYGDGGGLVTGGSSETHTYTAVGVYTCSVYVVTANGCTDTAQIYVTVGKPPFDSFTAEPNPVCYGQPVHFTNYSTGATNYYWYFGDGGGDSLTDPSYYYINPGTFTVTLVALDNGCASYDTMIITVDSPKAIIDLNYNCIPDNEVSFIDTSLGDNSHEWFFGDGTTSFAKDTVHFYPTLGIYTVVLTTYNTASGCRDTTTAIVDLIHPIITFTASATQVCKYGHVTFTPSVTGTSDVMEYAWYVDGVFKKDTSVFTDTFETTGFHTVMLIITDAHGCFDTLNKPNYIEVAKPAANFSVTPTIGCVVLTADFTDMSTDFPGITLSSFAWTFGDGGSATGASPTVAHNYTVGGTFIITEIVTDDLGCKDTTTGTVTAEQPTAAFYALPTYPCIGSTVLFTNTSSATVTCYWWFGDGTTSTAVSPTHVYSATGTYTVKLAVTNAVGCADTATYVNYIHVTEPTAAFTESDSFSICSPLSEVFTNTSTSATTFYWTFGDGSSSTDISPSDLYISVGDYTVTLVATNAYGCKDTTTHQVYIYGYAGGFSYGPDSGCVPLTVSFASFVTNVSSIIWDFGDGTTSSAHSTQDTVHTYIYPGAYVPKLILSDLTGCQASSIGADTIKVDGVEINYRHTPACINETVDFIDSTYSYWSTMNSYLWTFTPGTYTTTMVNPAYLYTAAGTYTVSLTGVDGWGCTTTQTQPVTVTGLPTITASADTVICVGDAATLFGYGGVSYTWSADINLSCTACNPTMASPTTPTTYTVTGANANGCTNTDTVTVYLKTKTISSGHGDTAVCVGTVVSIWDSGATKFAWSPPSGLNSTTVGSPNADPSVTTTYTVIAQLGSCIPDTNYVTITVYPLPTVNAGPSLLVVAGSQVQLDATGTNIYTYDWTPASTLSCANCDNPVANMLATTVYTVNVASIHGCLNSDTVLVDIYCSNTQIFMPNAFTPNGDGQDDVYYPRGSGLENIKSFRIYNRWGELLFERTNFPANDITYGWDGTFGGAPPRPDVYVYVLYATCETGQPLFLKGDVTIIK